MGVVIKPLDRSTAPTEPFRTSPLVVRSIRQVGYDRLGDVIEEKLLTKFVDGRKTVATYGVRVGFSVVISDSELEGVASALKLQIPPDFAGEFIHCNAKEAVLIVCDDYEVIKALYRYIESLTTHLAGLSQRTTDILQALVLTPVWYKMQSGGELQEIELPVLDIAHTEPTVYRTPHFIGGGRYECSDMVFVPDAQSFALLREFNDRNRGYLACFNDRSVSDNSFRLSENEIGNAAVVLQFGITPGTADYFRSLNKPTRICARFDHADIEPFDIIDVGYTADLITEPGFVGVEHGKPKIQIIRAVGTVWIDEKECVLELEEPPTKVRHLEL